ncbi:SDR family oxidoreductase [Haliangium sp.]|uniref:SDR family oxidoreductase n=1 Tax=Haliangium sp. TaxID=2663208 RepID=UPI003D0FBD33
MHDNMTGKLCIITGASAGIGKATARGLAAMGADLLLVCRDQARGDAAMREVSDAGAGSVTLLLGDLSSQEEIRRLADEILDRCERIDVLINNAGGIFGERRLTVDGLELTFALNHLAYFLLTHLLLERLQASGPARIINVSSDAHRPARLDWNNLQGERSYRAMSAYCTSKLANVLFTRELARRVDGGVSVHCMHPGAVRSNFGSTASPLFKNLVKLIGPFMRSPERGADTIVWLASAPEGAASSGGYFVDRTEKRPSRAARDEETARRLWAESERLVGLGGDAAA